MPCCSRSRHANLSTWVHGLLCWRPSMRICHPGKQARGGPLGSSSGEEPSPTYHYAPACLSAINPAAAALITTPSPSPSWDGSADQHDGSHDGSHGGRGLICIGSDVTQRLSRLPGSTYVTEQPLLCISTVGARGICSTDVLPALCLR